MALLAPGDFPEFSPAPSQTDVTTAELAVVKKLRRRDPYTVAGTQKPIASHVADADLSEKDADFTRRVRSRRETVSFDYGPMVSFSALELNGATLLRKTIRPDELVLEPWMLRYRRTSGAIHPFFSDRDSEHGFVSGDDVRIAGTIGWETAAKLPEEILRAVSLQITLVRATSGVGGATASGALIREQIGAGDEAITFNYEGTPSAGQAVTNQLSLENEIDRLLRGWRRPEALG